MTSSKRVTVYFEGHAMRAAESYSRYRLEGDWVILITDDEWGETASTVAYPSRLISYIVTHRDRRDHDHERATRPTVGRP